MGLISSEKVRVLEVSECSPLECRYCRMDGHGDFDCKKVSRFIGEFLPKEDSDGKKFPDWCPLTTITRSR